MNPVILIPVSYAILLSVLLKLTRPAYLAFRKRRSGFGTVFNTSSNIPEALVSLSLRDLHGRVIRTTVTDKHGRYRLIAPPGEYYVDARKAGFVFPSAFLGAREGRFVYDNVLPAQHIIIKDNGVITKNIPIDPIAGKRRFRIPSIILPKRIQYALAALSPVIAFGIAYIVRTNVILWLLFVGYLAILFQRLLSYKPAEPPFGTITDMETKRPLEHAVVRIFDAKFNKLLETQMTSAKGRYAFIVKSGAYYVLIKKEGYKSVRLNFPHIRRDGFLLVKDVKMKASKEIDPLEEKYGKA